jgi:hypothetical protein
MNLADKSIESFRRQQNQRSFTIGIVDRLLKLQHIQYYAFMLCFIICLPDIGNSVTILFENSAGQKNNIGSKFEEIRVILDELNSPREFSVSSLSNLP